jgi:hypothetical protein
MQYDKKKELVIGSGGVQRPGEFFTSAIRRKGAREGYKGLESGFSCGLGTDCTLPQKKERYGNNGFVPGATRVSNGNMGGAFTGNLSPAQYSGNLAADMSASAMANKAAVSRNRAAQDVTSKSDLRQKIEKRVAGGSMIANMREGKESFNRKKLDLSALEIKQAEEFKRRGTISDYSSKVENFNKRPTVREQYMRKVGGKGVSLRAQYGL